MKYCFLLSYTPNPRMTRRLSLVKEQYEVSMICWKRQENELWGSEKTMGINCHIVNIPANNGNPLKRIKPTLQFKRQAIQHLIKINPDFIHAENLDMLMIATAYKRRYAKSVQIIYEIADINSLLIDKQDTLLKRIAQYCLRWLDRKNSQYVSLLICTSERYYEVYYSDFILKENCIIVPNVPDPKPFRHYCRKEAGVFTVGYIGAIRYIDQAKLLIQVADQTGVHVTFAGSELGDEVKKICEGRMNIEYLGPYAYEKDIARLYGMIDCVYSAYDVKSANVGLALPNKLFESIYCELPIIVAKGTYLAEIVEQWGVGIAIDPNSIDELCSALHKLETDHECYNNIVASCRIQKQEMDFDILSSTLLSRIKNIGEKT